MHIAASQSETPDSVMNCTAAFISAKGSCKVMDISSDEAQKCVSPVWPTSPQSLASSHRFWLNTNTLYPAVSFFPYSLRLEKYSRCCPPQHIISEVTLRWGSFWQPPLGPHISLSPRAAVLNLPSAKTLWYSSSGYGDHPPGHFFWSVFSDTFTCMLFSDHWMSSCKFS